MKNDDRKVVFRRIGGRIVPIRQKAGAPMKVTKPGSGKGFGEAAGYVAAGVAAAAATSELASRAVKASAGMRIMASRQFRASNAVLRAATQGGQMLLDLGGNQALAKRTRGYAVLLRRGSQAVRSFRKPLALVGTFASGYLIGRGLEEGIERASGKQLEGKGEFGSQLAGNLVSGAISTLYYKRLGLPLRQAFKVARAAKAGDPYKFGRIPINTRFGQLKFKF